MLGPNRVSLGQMKVKPDLNTLNSELK